jgi:hypothetical protein
MPTPLTPEQQEQVVVLVRAAMAKTIARNMPNADEQARSSAALFAGQVCGQLEADLEREWPNDDVDRAPKIERGLLTDIITVIQSFASLTPPDAEVYTIFMDKHQLIGAMRQWGAWDTEYRESIMDEVARYLIGQDFPSESAQDYPSVLFDMQQEALVRGWKAYEPNLGQEEVL